MTGPVDHYADQYWNQLPGVLRYLNKRATSDPDVWWMDYFKMRYATPPRRRALVIGCGNGWVERDFYDRQIALEFDAFDASDQYLASAEAARDGRPITYWRATFADFVPRRTYDLIVNVAALHHADYLYRLTHRLSRALRPDGVFVMWDYVGPDRNQYPPSQVELMTGVNRSLPQRFRNSRPLRPMLETVLEMEPTEAVHASEVMRAVRAAFDLIEYRALGGGLAYQILWNNIEEFEQEDEESSRVLDDLLRRDEELTDTGAVPNMFAFAVGRRNGRRRPSVPLRRLLWEPVRERYARSHEGRYPRDVLRLGLKRRTATADG